MRVLRWVSISVLVMIIVSNAGHAAQFSQSKQIILPNLHTTTDSSDPPTIEWSGPAENSTETIDLLIDGMYSGQTEEVFAFEIWVNDTDGVDSVIFRFYWLGEWANRTTTLIEGNETRGLYAGKLTCSVAWDWINGHPNPSGHAFYFKVFANDTLGNSRETTSIHYSYGYFVIIPPFPFTLATPLGILGIVVTVCLVGGIVYRKWKRKQSTLYANTNSGTLS